MKISQQFDVASTPQVVWEFFQDVPSVAQCLPGAELLEVNDDGTYDGKLSVKLGPMTAAFEGTATVTPDPESMTAKIEGKGVDKRGGSRGQVKLDYKVSPAALGSSVEIDADVTLSGPAAQFGRTGLINEISKRLIGDFVDCLEGKLAAGSAEAAEEIKATEVKGLSLFFASLWGWFRGLFGGGDES
ncbi:MAG TPA: SRPBCC family protein [Acidimicrobiia bacterium]